MDIATAVTTDAAFARHNFAISVAKSNADQEEKLAEIIADNVVSVPVNEGRGTNVDISA